MTKPSKDLKALEGCQKKARLSQKDSLAFLINLLEISPAFMKFKIS